MATPVLNLVRSIVDDTLPLSCNIEKSQQDGDHFVIVKPMKTLFIVKIFILGLLNTIDKTLQRSSIIMDYQQTIPRFL